jgi:hypothetical protein
MHVLIGTILQTLTIVSETIPLTRTLRIEYQDIVIDAIGMSSDKLLLERVSVETWIGRHAQRPIQGYPDSRLNLFCCGSDDFRSEKIEHSKLIFGAESPPGVAARSIGIKCQLVEGYFGSFSGRRHNCRQLKSKVEEFMNGVNLWPEIEISSISFGRKTSEQPPHFQGSPQGGSECVPCPQCIFPAVTTDNRAFEGSLLLPAQKDPEFSVFSPCPVQAALRDKGIKQFTFCGKVSLERESTLESIL